MISTETQMNLRSSGRAVEYMESDLETINMRPTRIRYPNKLMPHQVISHYANKMDLNQFQVMQLLRLKIITPYTVNNILHYSLLSAKQAALCLSYMYTDPSTHPNFSYSVPSFQNMEDNETYLHVFHQLYSRVVDYWNIDDPAAKKIYAETELEATLPEYIDNRRVLFQKYNYSPIENCAF